MELKYCKIYYLRNSETFLGAIKCVFVKIYGFLSNLLKLINWLSTHTVKPKNAIIFTAINFMKSLEVCHKVTMYNIQCIAYFLNFRVLLIFTIFCKICKTQIFSLIQIDTNNNNSVLIVSGRLRGKFKKTRQQQILSKYF